MFQRSPQQVERVTPVRKNVDAYQHPMLVKRYMKKLDLSQVEAEQLFTDTKRFLYLCATSPTPMSPSAKIDEGWHEFILYTKDYQAFCQEHFGRFIHHIPDTPAVEGRVKEDRYVAVFGDTPSSNWNGAVDCTKCCCGPQPSCQDSDIKLADCMCSDEAQQFS